MRLKDDGATVQMGRYSLSRIAGGIVTVGCHQFDRAEIERFAAVLNVADADASEVAA